MRIELFTPPTLLLAEFALIIGMGLAMLLFPFALIIGMGLDALIMIVLPKIAPDEGKLTTSIEIGEGALKLLL